MICSRCAQYRWDEMSVDFGTKYVLSMIVSVAATPGMKNKKAEEEKEDDDEDDVNAASPYQTCALASAFFSPPHTRSAPRRRLF